VSEESTGRTYRFAPLNRNGALLGLSGVQCAALGLGVVCSGLLLNRQAPALAVVVPMIVGAVFAFAPVGGRAIHEWAPIALRWAVVATTGRTTWFAQLPARRKEVDPDRDGAPALPPPLAGLRIDESDVPWARRGRRYGAAVVRDRRERTLSATLRVQGRKFSLCERREQDRLLQLWGDALAGFCRERGAVSRMRWTEWAAPGGHDEQLAYLEANRRAPADAVPVGIYRDLLETAGPMATRHETLVTVTVDERRIRRRRGDRTPSADAVLLEEVRLLTARLEAAGLHVDPPLGLGELAAVFRSRLDPHAAPGVAGRRSLAHLTGISTPNAGPIVLRAAWDHVSVDRSVHAAYVVAEWPRLDMAANWMEPLLLHGGAIRTVALLCEPVAPSRSQRQIDRDATRLATDEEQRVRTGFRVGARHRRAQTDVSSREAELVAGYAELEFTGIVTVTAAEPAGLERACAEYEQVAAQCGIELRRLDGRHDLALACMLPIGRGVAKRRPAW